MKNTICAIAAALLFTIFAVSAFGQTAVIATFNQGWSLKGNSTQDTLNAVKTFGNNTNFVPGVTTAVVSVWKWSASTNKWSFYTTRMDSNGLTNYAANKGYDVLIDIFPGEGYWVFTETGAAIAQVGFLANYLIGNWNINGLPSGWNLIASPVSATPSEMSAMLTSAPPMVTDTGSNSSVVSLWMWDTVSGNWFFYSPSFAQSGPDALRNYVYQRGFLDFSSMGKKIEPGEGFWLNYNPMQQPYYGGKG